MLIITQKMLATKKGHHSLREAVMWGGKGGLSCITVGPNRCSQGRSSWFM